MWIIFVKLNKYIFFTDEWTTLLLKNYEWFLSNMDYKSDETKRSKDKKNGFLTNKLSFKTLIFD